MSAGSPTIEELHDELKMLKMKVADLEARIMLAERTTDAVKREHREEMAKMGTKLGEVSDALETLQSREDTNFMAQMHILGVIARKLKIPPKELKTGSRQGKD